MLACDACRFVLCVCVCVRMCVCACVLEDNPLRCAEGRCKVVCVCDGDKSVWRIILLVGREHHDSFQVERLEERERLPSGRV